MRSRSFVTALFVSSVLALSGAALAQTPGGSGAATARELLKHGAELRKEGRCAEAIAPLSESLRLDANVKTFINLADCEEQTGRLVDALGHWLQARDLAQRDRVDDVRAEADRRFKKLDPRVPRLVLTIRPDTPRDAEIKRDDVLAQPGAPAPVDPGAHVIVVRAKGFQPRTFEVTVTEGETRRLEVTSGEREPQPLLGPSSAHGDPSLLVSPAPSQPAERRAGSGTRTMGYVLLGAGAVGLGVGSIFGLRALSKKSDSDSHCDASGCDDTGFQLRTDGRSAATVSTLAFVLGGAAGPGGLSLVLLAPSSPSSARIDVAPQAGGLAFRGRF